MEYSDKWTTVGSVVVTKINAIGIVAPSFVNAVGLVAVRGSGRANSLLPGS